ncbi:MAG: 5-bromo-4-chloroindolyl phosphate hydrolysis family protein [Thermoleophilia bacterium]
MQQLAPQTHALATVDTPPPTARRARFRWWWRHSLWIAWTFTGGLANWLAFVYIGVRARHLPWALAGFAYLLPLVATILAIGTPYLQIAIAVQFVVSAISVANALYWRPYYRAIMFGDASPRSLPAPPQPPPLLAASERPALPKGIDEAAAEVLRPARAQIDTLLEHASAIGKADIRDEVVALCRTADQIVGELAKHPHKVAAARSFLTYYLDAAARIVDGYVYLLRRDSSAPEITKTVARAEDSLRVVQQAFDRQLAGVLEDRALDLDSEIELLERTVRNDTMYTQTGEQT